jgi:hypothetical protein
MTTEQAIWVKTSNELWKEEFEAYCNCIYDTGAEDNRELWKIIWDNFKTFIHSLLDEKDKEIEELKLENNLLHSEREMYSNLRKDLEQEKKKSYDEGFKMWKIEIFDNKKSIDDID